MWLTKKRSAQLLLARAAAELSGDPGRGWPPIAAACSHVRLLWPSLPHTPHLCRCFFLTGTNATVEGSAISIGVCGADGGCGADGCGANGSAASSLGTGDASSRERFFLVMSRPNEHVAARLLNQHVWQTLSWEGISESHVWHRLGDDDILCAERLLASVARRVSMMG